MNTEFILKLLKLASRHDITGSLVWTEDLEFAIFCNDLFAPAADAETIESGSDLELLDQSMGDIPIFGELLYCARRRGSQPQAKYFDFLKKDEKKHKAVMDVFALI